MKHSTFMEPSWGKYDQTVGKKNILMSRYRQADQEPCRRPFTVYQEGAGYGYTRITHCECTAPKGHEGEEHRQDPMDDPSYRRSFDDMEQQRKDKTSVVSAFIEVMDGIVYAEDIQKNTGLSLDRCKEILDLRSRLVKAVG